MTSSSRIPTSPQVLPVDPRLPELAALTHPDRALRLLAPSSPLTLEPARVRYLEYDPGRFFLIHLRVGSGTDLRDVVVSRVHDIHAGNTGLGRAGGDSLPDDADELRIAWYPVDLGLPLLAEPVRLAELLHLDPASEPSMLAWTPQRRAVLRVGNVVVKLYPTVAEATASRDHLETVSRLLPSARLVHAEVSEGAVAQTALGGEPLTRDEALTEARGAGRIARRLHAAEAPAGLGVHTPEVMLDVCAPVVRLTVFAQPQLADRIKALEHSLRASAPAPGDLVLSHGDLNWGQLLRTAPGRLALLDTDTLCLAPAAFDLSSYAANLVSGREEDLRLALRVLDEVVAGYGVAPPNLQWWLSASILRRMDRAIRRLKRTWPRRTEGLLAAAEQTAPR